MNSTGRSNRLVSNDASVDYGNGVVINSNRVSNPVPGSSSSGRSGGGGGSGSGSGGGSGAGGPGSSGSSEGEGDTWDLLPLSQTGQGRAMLFGGVALAVSAMALIILLWYRRRETKD